MLPLSGRPTLQLPSINTSDSELLFSPDLPITLFFSCSPESFPSLFDYIHLNPGLFIVCTVYDSINGDQIIYT